MKNRLRNRALLLLLVLFFPLSIQFFHEIIHADHHQCLHSDCQIIDSNDRLEITNSTVDIACLITQFEYLSSYNNNQTVELECLPFSISQRQQILKEQEVSAFPSILSLRAPPCFVG